MGRYLVTGGCGFIGSHLVDALLERGDRVVVVDNLSTGKRSYLPAGVEFLSGDVADVALIHQAMQGVDGCFHLAAIASVERSNQEWLKTHHVNLTGTINVFDQAYKVRPDQPIPVVYASSAAIYGNKRHLPIHEKMQPSALTAYAADKFGCELHARAAGQVHSIPTLGLRFFNVYGPRQDPNSAYTGVISIFLSRLRQGQPLTIYGDGQQTRDFIFVEDVVRFLLKGMALASTRAPVYNACTGRGTSVIELAELVGRVLRRPVNIQYQPRLSGDIYSSVGCPKRAYAALGLRADTSLEEGLQSMLEFASHAV